MQRYTRGEVSYAEAMANIKLLETAARQSRALGGLQIPLPRNGGGPATEFFFVFVHSPAHRVCFICD